MNNTENVRSIETSVHFSAQPEPSKNTIKRRGMKSMSMGNHIMVSKNERAKEKEEKKRSNKKGTNTPYQKNRSRIIKKSCGGKKSPN